MKQSSNQSPDTNIITPDRDLRGQLEKDDSAIANLVGYFDVLIEMNLELTSQERKVKDGSEDKPDELGQLLG